MNSSSYFRRISNSLGPRAPGLIPKAFNEFLEWFSKYVKRPWLQDPRPHPKAYDMISLSSRALGLFPKALKLIPLAIPKVVWWPWLQRPRSYSKGFQTSNYFQRISHVLARGAQAYSKAFEMNPFSSRALGRIPKGLRMIPLAIPKGFKYPWL